MHTRGSHVRRAASVLSIGALLLTGVAATAAAEPAPEGAPTTVATDEPVEPAATVMQTPVFDPMAIPSPEPTDSPGPEPMTSPAPEPGLTPDPEPAPTPSPEPVPTEAAVTLVQGSTSARVADLQRALDGNATKDYYLGRDTNPVSTIFTPQTAAALRAWQTDNGFRVTGTIRTHTPEWNALMSQRGPARKAQVRGDLAVGVTHDWVPAVQAALHNNVAKNYSSAFRSGVYDAYFGPLLRTALAAWQQDNGYPATGAIPLGSEQWTKLMASQKITPVVLRTPEMIGLGTTHRHVPALQSALDRNNTRDFLAYSNGVYDRFAGPTTIDGLKQAQKHLGYPVTGRIVIDSMQWHHMRQLATRSKTDIPGPIMRQGVRSSWVKTLQEKLDRNKVRDYFSHSGAYTTFMGPTTVAGLKSWQRTNGYPVTGQITGRSIQWYHLHSQMGAAPRLDPRCYTTGVVVCASKTDRKLYYVNKGKIIKTLDARFGGRNYDTRGRLRTYSTKEGSFTITRKVRNEVSYSYGNTPMPFSAYFYGGQAFHYSYGFAKDGWVGDWGSHGCINLRSWSGAQWLFENVRPGTRVVVYK